MDTALSKTLSYFLRHAPDEGDLTMDEQGYVPAEELAELLRGKNWPAMNEQRLLDLVEEPEVERFERLDHWIRASYGHSVDVDPEHSPVDPPRALYHGTSRKALESIKEEGLKPMGRQYVHLSRTVEEARRVGHRHDSSPVVLEINPPETTDRTFYRAGPVILVEYVPPDWIREYEVSTD